MKYITLLLLILYTNLIYSSTYIVGEFGKSQFVSNVTEKYNLKSIGNDYSFSFGKTVQYIGFEAFVQLHDTTANITHNSVKYLRKENATTYGANIRFNLEYTYFKVGYALHSLKGRIKTTSDTAVNDSKMDEIYQTGSSKDSTSGGINYGVGLQYRFTKSFRVVLGYDYYETGKSDTHFHRVAAGIVMKLPDFNVDFKE